jgi:DNA repair protein RecO (recombination protein O)
MIEKIEGIVISEKDYSETSKILNVVTRNYGVIGVIAKGCKSMKSELRSVTGKLTYGYFNLYYKPGKLSSLISVDVIDSFRNIKTDIKRISYASFLLDLTEQVMKQSYQTEIYELFVNSLIKINEGFDPMVISNILELKYLDHLGVMPIIDACSICGSTNSIATLSSNKGGYICNRCYKNEKIVSSKTIKMIRMFCYVDISKISKLDISDQVKREINDFLDEYYDQYTGLYLKSKTFLKNLNKIS